MFAVLFAVTVLLAPLHAQTPPAEGPAPAPAPGPAPDTEASAVDSPRAPEIVVTALRHPGDAFDAPASVSVLGEEELTTGPDSRSLPNAMARLPSVQVQKTGPGQSSPYLRGFTGFRTLLLIDGIRLNNSVFRDGPNQYWGTVDAFSIESLELVRGPASVLWGSDAVGGAVNALTGVAPATDEWHLDLFTRWSSAEQALFQRAEIHGGKQDVFGLRFGITDKHFGDIRSGDGKLPGTAYDERAWDLRLDVPVEPGLDLTFVAQHVRQDDVPRTHRTVDAVPFEGTTIGPELRRDLDQERDLVYGRVGWDGDGGLYDHGRLTLSWQRQQELQQRLRTGGLYDESGFDVVTRGVQLEFESRSPIGRLTWGLESFRDEVDSFRSNFENGVLVSQDIQGPVADDARYHLFGLFVQDEISQGDFDHVLGLRWTHASAVAKRVDDPTVPGSDPTTPGNILSMKESWSALVGSARTTWHAFPSGNLYGGVSQGFRAPNLSDLTSELTDSGIESPTPDLEPEYFTQLEVGARTHQGGLRAQAAVHYTFIRDMIVPSPTGEIIDSTPVLQKSNVGDGYLWGLEGQLEYDLNEEWLTFARASWMDGSVKQFSDAGEKVTEPISRLQPLTVLVGLTWAPPEASWWLTADSFHQARADKLSLKDKTDTERIPPGGTPSWGVLGVRVGKALSQAATLTVGLENLLDSNYRIHGSGVNEPGRSLVLALALRF